ncbi:Fanconi anemia group J protein homolog isoform X2 [Corticium candelabrum]|uniref:Fanconi anemia group J protein homolog isoform X2 n=1 Tax=Corticium candelabrum TaxID=121492 RepID=UPI002E25ACB6|nr:Fanconi anemia group J protein homolog isoform X2 [Corticium candelabrum]
MASEALSYSVSGIKVSFPIKPYPSQLSMMAKIIKGIEKQENSLLESPTGSGKSLALLCSVLAWQSNERAKQRNQEITDTGHCTCAQYNGSTVPVGMLSTTPQGLLTTQVICADKASPSYVSTELFALYLLALPFVSSSQQSVDEIAEDSDFKFLAKKFRLPGYSLKRPRPHIGYEDHIDDFTKTQVSEQKHVSLLGMSPSILQSGVGQLSYSYCPKQDTHICEFCTRMEGESVAKMKAESSLPKVYFGTRTHRQIAQIVRELKKTSYHDAKMCVLGSREQNCIHPGVSRSKHKNEECQKLLALGQPKDGGGCQFFRGTKVRNYEDLRGYGFETAWDLEELVSFGKETMMCPYFVSRNLLTGADIIFCPYNYLIDPKIRHQMGIDLEGQIVVLDEAHNIEDFSRDAASFSVSIEELQVASDEMSKMAEVDILPKSHQMMNHMCAVLLEWIDTNKSQVAEHDFETQYKVVTGPEFVMFLAEKGIIAANLHTMKDHFSQVASNAMDAQRLLNVVTTSTLTVLEGLLLALAYLIDHEGKYALDYRVAVGRVLSLNAEENVDAWRQRRSMKRMQKAWKYSLYFWCLNPAVAFTQVSSLARCVIVSSGTLSPLSTFSSELGTNFPIRLEASHVIRKEQVWVGSLGIGPNGTKMDGRFKSSETFEYQDEVGEIVLQVCKIIPFGVLCFVPSYSHLDKFYKRWQNTGLMKSLVKLKCVLTEPRGSEKTDFEGVLQEFYDIIQRADEADARGALLIAVCRGKVSEGLDFADNNARAVITIGIPFPSIKDVQVELKRRYNDQYANERGLLRGALWYETQAFRALNQALGRCLRHRSDWGALLMIDERFGHSEKYIRGLSKWIRHQVQHFGVFDVALDSIKKFSFDRMSDSQGHNIDSSMIADTSVVSVMSPVKSATCPSIRAVATLSQDNQVICNTSTTSSSPAFVTASQIYGTHTIARSVSSSALQRKTNTMSPSPFIVRPSTGIQSQYIGEDHSAPTITRAKNSATPLLFSTLGSEDFVDGDCTSFKQTSMCQNESISCVPCKDDGQSGFKEDYCTEEQDFPVAQLPGNVRIGHKHVRARLETQRECVTKDDLHLLSLFDKESIQPTSTTQFIYPEEVADTMEENIDSKAVEGEVRCKSCKEQLVAALSAVEVSCGIDDLLSKLGKSCTLSKCFVCTEEDLTVKCIVLPQTSTVSWPFSALNCIWSEAEGLSYVPLVCSNCGTHCSPESPPLVGFKVVSCSRPSLMERLNKVYLLQSAVDYTQ